MNIFSKKYSQGFTLIELMIVATIIIIMTGLGVVSFSTTNVKARNGKREADIAQVRSALELYRSVNGEYPSTSSFSTMLNQIDEYVSSPNIRDPKNTSPYVFTYVASGGGTGYTMTYRLEPDATTVTLTDP